MSNSYKEYASKEYVDSKIPSVVTTESDGLMSSSDKIKLDSIDNDTNKIIVDTSVSDTSTNPIANQTIKSYVDSKVANIVESAPETLDTLNELAAALGDDPNFATTVAAQIGNKVDKIDGKGLSTNDYTTAEKEKLAGIAAGATKVTSPADIGAVSKSGDTMTGSLRIEKNTPVLYIADTTSGREGRLQYNGELTYIHNLLDTTHYATIILDKETSNMANLLRVQQKNGDTTNTYSVIHEGNKNLITSTDIGAQPASTAINTSNIGSQSVASATKATQDGSGNNIVNTYATKTELTNGLNGKLSTSGGTLTGTIDYIVASAGGHAIGNEFKNSDGTRGSGAGVLASNGSISSYFISVGSGDWWQPSNGLQITSSSIKWKNNDLIHAGNIGSQSVTSATNATNIHSTASTSKAYVLGTTTTGSSNKATVYNASVYTSGSVLYGAGWNDYAEYREGTDTFEPGRVVCENGDDTLSLAIERLQPGAEIVSDTFGFAIGENEKCQTPIAVSGRVLAYPYEDRYSYKPGDAVCAAPGGTVSKMTREEIREYPERIVGTVSAIPEYETWGEGNVPVNGRIWIKVK